MRRGYWILSLLLLASFGCAEDVERDISPTVGETARPVAEPRHIARAALPEYKVLPGLFGADGAFQGPAERSFRSLGLNSSQYETWHRSHGDDGASKYSRLEQITRDNVGRLGVVWEFDSALAHPRQSRADRSWRGNVEANPVVGGRRLFSVTPQDSIVALDATTGELLWEFAAEVQPLARRGMLYRPATARSGERLYFSVGAELHALDATTGTPDLSFGDGGRIAIGISTTAPAIVGQRLIATTTVPPAVHARDAETGEALWDLPLTSEESRIGNSPWGGFSVDEARNLAFVTTGNPRPPLYGAGRPGPNRPSNSVLAIDLETGETRWSFQEVAHDLWNLDLPGPPVLTTLAMEGEPLDVVAAVTKLGNTLLLERDSGRPVFDYRLRRAPPGVMPGEETHPYQPDLELPEPFASPAFGLEDVTDIGEGNRKSVLFQLDRATYGWFEPPRLARPSVHFGLHGGAEWSGAAVNHDTSRLYIPVNRVPWQIRVYLLPRTKQLPDFDRDAAREAKALYLARCASCHGSNREGNYTARDEVELDYAPSLVGLSQLPDFGDVFEVSRFEARHAREASDAPQVDAATLASLSTYFEEVDLMLGREGGLRITSMTSQLIDEEGYPGSKPPWGELVALDLGTGRIAWRVPLGEYEDLTARGTSITGQPNYGGVLATRGGLVFATGTIDGQLRAFDGDTGALLWSHRLAAAGSAPPLSYSIDGRQYIAVVGSGGRFHNFREKASMLYVFALPEADEIDD